MRIVTGQRFFAIKFDHIRDRLIKLFLGQLSLEDLDRECAEVFFHHPDLRRIIGILFPKKPSFIYSVN